MTGTVRYVRYVSPFGSPALLPEPRAKKYLLVDSAMWDVFSAAGALSDAQRAVGAPRIEVSR